MTQFLARSLPPCGCAENGRGEVMCPPSTAPADQLNQVDWLELSRRAFNERFLADDWEDATEVYGD